MAEHIIDQTNINDLSETLSQVQKDIVKLSRGKIRKQAIIVGGASLVAIDSN
jgi:hypothetical protein